MKPILIRRRDEMDGNSSAGIRGMVIFGALLVAACAGYGGGDLKPGVSMRPEVLASMGEPAMAWKNPDGSQQLAYPRGPSGKQSFMAYLGPDGRLQRIEKVLDGSQFQRIRPGMSKDEVLRILGPPGTPYTQFYARRNELAWSWLFCSHNAEEFFDVMFDDATGIVRSTGQHPNLVGLDGVQPRCGH